MQATAEVQFETSHIQPSMDILQTGRDADLAVEGMTLEEIYNLFDPDPSLQLQIESMFSDIEKQYRTMMKVGSVGEARVLTTKFRESIGRYLRLVSKKVYVPVRRRLQISGEGAMERFSEFEISAARTNGKIGQLLERLCEKQSNTVDSSNIELTAVMHLLASQLKAERAYLLPLYTDREELIA